MAPTTEGPTQPPRLPNELIRPMLAAAAEAVINRLGRAQNAGKYALTPVMVRVNRATESQRFPLLNGASARAAAPIRMGNEACQRRSRVRSEFQPIKIWPINEPT